MEVKNTFIKADDARLVNDYLELLIENGVTEVAGGLPFDITSLMKHKYIGYSEVYTGLTFSSESTQFTELGCTELTIDDLAQPVKEVSRNVSFEYLTIVDIGLETYHIVKLNGESIAFTVDTQKPYQIFNYGYINLKVSMKTNNAVTAQLDRHVSLKRVQEIALAAELTAKHLNGREHYES